MIGEHEPDTSSVKSMHDNAGGEFIRFKRKELGLSLQDFAEKIGVSIVQASAFERGKQILPLKKLWGVCRALSLSLENAIVLSLFVHADLDQLKAQNTQAEAQYFDIHAALMVRMEKQKEVWEARERAMQMIFYLIAIVAAAYFFAAFHSAINYKPPEKPSKAFQKQIDSFQEAALEGR